MIRLDRPNVNTVEYWDRRYRDEVEDMWRIWNTGDLIAKIAKHIPFRARVLDVGCGAGIVPSRIAQVRSDVQWSASDFSVESVSYLKRLGGVRFTAVFQADLGHPLPVRDGSYDVVLCTEVLEHLERPAFAVREFARVAWRKVIVSVPNGKSIDSYEHIWRYTAAGLRSLFAPHGGLQVETARNGRNLIGVLCK